MAKIKWRLTVLLSLSSVVYTHHPALSGGYEVKTSNAESLGQANAGGVAQFGKVEYMTRNPALLAHMTHNQAVATAAYISPHIKFSTPTASVKSNKSLIVPSAFLGISHLPYVKFGVAVSLPFGLETSYKKDSEVRYWNLNSKMKTITINPAFARIINEQWAIGGGILIEYMKVELTRAVNTPLIIASAISQAPAVTQAPLSRLAAGTGLALGSGSNNDIGVKVKGDDWGVGANMGVTYKPFHCTQLGLSYRSEIKHTLKGNKSLQIPDTTQTSLNNFYAGAPAFRNVLQPNFSNANISSSSYTPSALQFGFDQKINHEWSVLGDIVWTHWSLVKEIRIKTTNVANVRDDVSTLKWKDTVAGSLGLNFRPKALKGWVFRLGTAYDPTPIRDQYRQPAIPDNDRYWLSGGVGWAPKENVKFSLSYSHEFVKNAKSNLKPAAGTTEALKGDLQGKYNSSVDIVMAQASYQF